MGPGQEFAAAISAAIAQLDENTVGAAQDSVERLQTPLMQLEGHSRFHEIQQGYKALEAAQLEAAQYVVKLREVLSEVQSSF